MMVMSASLLLAACGNNDAPESDDNGGTEEAQTETLTGQAQGFGGVITVTVTKDGDTITKVEVDAPDESEGVADPAIEEIPEAIVEANSTDIDTVSGATYTSQGIIDAVNNALDPEAYPFEEEEEASREEVELAEDGLYTGFGADISMADSEDNEAKTTSVSVGVTLDGDKKIVDIQADALPSTIEWDDEGKLVDQEGGDIESAKQGGDAEWLDKITAFEEEAIGKSLEEIQEMDADEQLISATEKAIESSLSLGATEGDKLGFGVVNKYDVGHSASADASDEGDGNAQAYATYAVVTVDDSGVITSAIIDASQANVNFDEEGNITSDTSEPVTTKADLRDAYGMRGASEIGKEWFEQAWAIADFAEGKTLDEFLGVEVDDADMVTDVDLVSSATMAISEITMAVEYAVNNAQ